MRNIFRGIGGFLLSAGFIAMILANGLLGSSLMLMGGLILYLSVPKKPKN